MSANPQGNFSLFIIIISVQYFVNIINHLIYQKGLQLSYFFCEDMLYLFIKLISKYFYDCRIVKETLLFMMPSVKREMICLPCCWITIWLTSWSQTTTGLTHFTMQLCEEIQGRRNFFLIHSFRFNDGRKYS